MRHLALLLLPAFALACAAEPADISTTGPVVDCFGCACGPDLPCGEGLECVSNVCSLIEETGDELPPSACGWNPIESWYDCGFQGEDPGGEFPRECPAGLTADTACPAALPSAGCCDDEGDVWYCEDGKVVATSC